MYKHRFYICMLYRLICKSYHFFAGRWFTTCTGILNIMVILGFMFNYMLRVNLTIAIVDMVVDVNKTKNSTTPGPKFEWDKFQVNDALGSFFWGYILTELPGSYKKIQSVKKICSLKVLQVQLR